MCPNFSNRGGLGAKHVAKNCCQKRLNQCLSLDWPKLKWLVTDTHCKLYLFANSQIYIAKSFEINFEILSWLNYLKVHIPLAESFTFSISQYVVT